MPIEDWPPDEAGLIQGVGFDMAGGNQVLFSSLSRFNDPNSQVFRLHELHGE